MPQIREHAALNHLIETCRDAAREFHTAADHARDQRMKALFERLADARARFAAELAPHAQRLGGDAPADGTRTAALRRGWLEVKARVTHYDDRAVLADAEDGDDATLHVFRDTMEGMLPPDAREVIEHQYDTATTEHVEIMNLR
jgi:uncharacterized protein (TIGR02284 family)